MTNELPLKDYVKVCNQAKSITKHGESTCIVGEETS